jgi:PIN domain nuclease of toxin-antitoxin system
LVAALEAVIHLDTHVIVWLYDGQTARFPDTVKGALEENALLFSPMVELELEYLYEIGRLQVNSTAVLTDLKERIGIRVSSAHFEKIIEHARDLRWTRDPFDRVIVATAMADDVALITRDATILANYALARWDAPPPRPKIASRRRAPKRTRR